MFTKCLTFILIKVSTTYFSGVAVNQLSSQRLVRNLMRTHEEAV